MQKLYDIPDFTIMYDPIQRWLHVIWRGEHNEEVTRACCLMILNKVRLTQSARILNDSSQALNGWSKLVPWIGQEFFQALADSGVEAIAWVIAHDWPARTDINKVMTYTTRPLVDTFEDAESAYSWLRSVSATQ